jgi:multidrug efflux system membrane fusion protein
MKSIKLIIAITFLLSAGCRNEKVKTTSQEVTGVRITTIAPETISIPIHSSGILVSGEEMKLSFKTGGIVSKIQMSEGDMVKKGEILAILNLSEINAQVRLAGNGYDKAVRDYNRAKNLYTDSVATLEQIQNAATVLDVAKSTLDIAQFNQIHSKIIAPEDGVILKQFVKTNELISSGYPVFLFGASGRNWKVKTGISDRDIVRINPGDSAVVKFDAWPGIMFSAAIDQVGEMSNPLTGTYEVEMILIRTASRMATGFIGAVEIYPSKKETFIMVPVEAIVDADGQEGYVYSVTETMTVQKIKVEIVEIAGSKAAIRGNLNGIREIVSEGSAYLRDGEKVRIMK